MATIETVYALAFSMTDILLVALVALIFFGGKKIPEVAKGLGAGIRNFRDGMKGEDEKDPVKGDEAERKP
jgi:sec-independent protein translocase protein TatA